jgi:hypothetical protein
MADTVIGCVYFFSLSPLVFDANQNQTTVKLIKYGKNLIRLWYIEL